MLRACLLSLWLATSGFLSVLADDDPRLSPLRVIISTTFGDVHVGFFPDVRHHPAYANAPQKKPVLVFVQMVG